jgi:ribosomal protein S12 methylthiotransferase accessory factor
VAPARAPGPHTRYRLDPAAAWWTDEGSLVLYGELGPLLLPAGAAADLAATVIERLADAPTQADLINAYDPGLRPNVASILDLLLKTGVAAPDSTCASRIPAEEARFYRLLDIDPQEAKTSRESFNLLVSGLSSWAIETIELVARAGVQGIAIIDWGSGVAEDPLRPARLDSVARFASFEAYQAAGLPHPQLILSGGDRENFDGHYRSEALAAAIRVPALFASLSGFEAIAGPLFVPGASTCWTCARRRLAGTNLNPREAARFEELLRTGGLSGAPQAQLPATRMVLAALVAQEIDRFAAGYGQSTLKDGLAIHDLFSLGTSVHRLLPMPDCRRCSEIVPKRSAIRVTSLLELMASTAGLVDERTGIISAVALRPVSGEAEWPLCARALPSAWIGDGSAAAPESAGGKGTSVVAAHLGAIGESVERYAAARIDPARLRFCRSANLPGRSLPPTEFCLYEPGQYSREDFPYLPYEPEASLPWIEGVSLQSGEPIWVPAQIVYFADDIEGAPALCQVTTNGLAAGLGFEDAAARAICELIERDAVMMTWLAHLPARRIPIEALQPSLELDGVLQALGGDAIKLEIYLLDAGLAIPCVVSLLIGENSEKWPAVTAASAANLSLDQSIKGAVLENAYSGRSVRDLWRDPSRRMPGHPEDIECFMDHALYYCAPEKLPAFDFIRRSAPLDCPCASGEPWTDPLQELRARLVDAVTEIVLVDLTTPDIAAFGFNVVRALGKNLQPLHCGYGMERGANPRLNALAAHLNPDPHPLC